MRSSDDLLHPARRMRSGPRMIATAVTRGDVLRGFKARCHDLGNAIFGVPLTNIRHTGLIGLAPWERLLDVGCGTGRVLGNTQGGVTLHLLATKPGLAAAPSREREGSPDA